MSIRNLLLKMPSLTRRSLVFAVALTFLWDSSALALEFQADFRNSSYQVGTGDTFSDLLAQHQGESLIQSNVITGLEDISTQVYAGGVNEDYSILMQARFDVGTRGEYTFQVGTDWGWGGAAALIDNDTASVLDEQVIMDDLWWANDWDNSDVFTTTFDFEVGDSFTLMWVGFEGCCGGTSTIRFSVDGSDFAPLTTDNFGVYTVPEPSTALLLGLGMLGLAAQRRH